MTPSLSSESASRADIPYILRPLHRIGAALAHRAFRDFLFGFFLSNIGSWMQTVAQAWLIFDLTHSPFYLGLDGFAATLPISLFAFWGGVIADRFDRRRLLLASQSLALVLALTLGVLIQTGAVRVWHILLISLLTGLSQSVAWPVYQAIMGNLVDKKTLPNAIALNSAQFNLARMLGPVLGAFALKRLGAAGCFYANALSFIPAIVVLVTLRLRPSAVRADHGRPSLKGALRGGFEFLRAEPPLFWLLVTLAVTSVLGFPLVTLLPVFARDILGADAGGFGFLVGAMGAGAVLAGFIVAYRGDFPNKERSALRAMGGFVMSMAGMALSRHLALSIIWAFIMGGTMVSFSSVINSLVQSRAPDHLRGRAISVFVFAFGGCMPLGNLVAGALAKGIGAPSAVLLQAALLGAFVVYVAWRHPEVYTPSQTLQS
jgi:MFS family permease